jgi:flagellar biogenesis protein FliO
MYGCLHLTRLSNLGAKAYFAWDGSGLFVLILFIIIFFWWVTRLVGKSVIY